jgi:cytidyltransferase-like protein
MKYRYGIASLYANPLHAGHLDYLEGAKSQCDYLIVIVNNDHQVDIKGSKVFMDEEHRHRIVQALKVVDEAFISFDQDSSVSKTLYSLVKRIKEERTGGIFSFLNKDRFLFFNSGDRNPQTYDKQEKEVCNKLGIQMVFLPMEKKYSSSLLKELDKDRV